MGRERCEGKVLLRTPPTTGWAESETRVLGRLRAYAMAAGCLGRLAGWCLTSSAGRASRWGEKRPDSDLFALCYACAVLPRQFTRVSGWQVTAEAARARLKRHEPQPTEHTSFFLIPCDR